MCVCVCVCVCEGEVLVVKVNGDSVRVNMGSCEVDCGEL